VNQVETQMSTERAQHLAKMEQHKEVLGQLFELYADLFSHDGYGDIGVEIKILRRGQKEVILHCGKQFRYVLDCDNALAAESPIKALLKRDLLS